MNFRPASYRPPQPDASSDQPQSFIEQFGRFWRRNVMWILLAALGLLILQDIFGTHGVLAMRRAQHEAFREQEEIDRINQENVQLQNRVSSLKSDPQAIERIAREQMGLARPGEYIFKTSPKDSGNDGSSSSGQSHSSPKKH